MTQSCQMIRATLLEAEEPHPDRCDRPDLAEHLATCTDCRDFALQLAGIEGSIKGLPTPSSAQTSCDRFLREQTVVIFPRADWRSSVRKWTFATAALVFVVTAGFFLLPTQTVTASTTLVEQLVDRNVRLAAAETRGEREALYREQSDMRDDMATLSLTDRMLAERLLAQEAWLVENDDPLEEAERFQDLADHFMDRLEENVFMDRAAADYVRLYSTVMQKGVKANLAKAEKRKAKQSQKRKQRLQHLAKRSKMQNERLEGLTGKARELTKKQIRAAKTVENAGADKVIAEKQAIQN